MDSNIKGFLVLIAVLGIIIIIIYNTVFVKKEVRHNFFLNIWAVVFIIALIVIAFKACTV